MTDARYPAVLWQVAHDLTARSWRMVAYTRVVHPTEVTALRCACGGIREAEQGFYMTVMLQIFSLHDQRSSELGKVAWPVPQQVDHDVPFQARNIR